MKIPLFQVAISEDVIEPVKEVLMSGYVGQGDKVEEFEKELRSHLGTPHINTTYSGTAAIHLAIHLLNLNPGDEVLTTPLTCTATNFPILANDLGIKWVDINPYTCNMDMNDLARKISPTTKAILVVHWGGYPCDLDNLREIQQKCVELHGFCPPIIEDCAHAWGATYNTRLLGNHGNICCFSFQAIKHLTSVDGGLLVTPNDILHQRAKLLRWYGLDRTRSAQFRCEQDIQEWGFKFHMNDLNAAIGLHNLPKVNDIVKKHKENGKYFNRELSEVAGVTLLENAQNRESSYWIYTMRVERRSDFTRKMGEVGIATSQVHDRNDKHTCLKQYRCILPNTDSVCSDMICIPCGWWVDQEGREYIVDQIKKGW